MVGSICWAQQAGLAENTDLGALAKKLDQENMWTEKTEKFQLTDPWRSFTPRRQKTSKHGK